jgi:hypothetical protein
MPGKSNYTAEFTLNLIYKGMTNSDLASAAGSAGNIYFALHTADPTDAGVQSSNEVTTAQCGAYARVAVTRGAGFGTVITAGGASSISPAAAVTFPTTTSSGTGCVATHFSTGVGSAGSTAILHSGTISPPISIPATTAGVIPQLTAATVISES